jgi:hypothetical protein
MIFEVHFHSASPDGLRKYIESNKCHLDGVEPSFDFLRRFEDGHYALRYVTCCKEFHDQLRRKVLSLHADAKIQEVSREE